MDTFRHIYDNINICFIVILLFFIVCILNYLDVIVNFRFIVNYDICVNYNVNIIDYVVFMVMFVLLFSFLI